MPKVWAFSLIIFLCNPLPVAAACNIVNGQTYGDCSGVTVNTQTGSFRNVSGYEVITGISAGARVLPGGTLVVSGMADHVLVDEGGRADIKGQVGRLEVAGSAEISGMVGHVALIQGGEIILEGMIQSISGTGKAHLRSGSTIAGQPTIGNQLRELK